MVYTIIISLLFNITDLYILNLSMAYTIIISLLFNITEISMAYTIIISLLLILISISLIRATLTKSASMHVLYAERWRGLY